MPQRNIYVKEEDQEVFEKAKDLLGEKSLSETVVEAVKQYVKDKESGKESKYGRFTRERLPVGRRPREDAPDHWIEFTGRMLANHREEREEKESGLKEVKYVIYQGSMGGYLLTYKLEFSSPPDVRGKSETKYVVGNSVEELKVKSEQRGWDVPISLLEEAKEELGGQLIEFPLAELKMGR